jgi:hypothetical protein
MNPTLYDIGDEPVDICSLLLLPMMQASLMLNNLRVNVKAYMFATHKEEKSKTLNIIFYSIVFLCVEDKEKTSISHFRSLSF